MATKTISIDMAAYERLKHARLSPGESFSKVIRRAKWDQPGHTCAAFLTAMEALPALGDDTLARLEGIQQADAPPEDAWQGPLFSTPRS